MSQPTLHDVAARAGVSIKTVSNVLRGVEGRVSARTAARVHQVIEEIGSSVVNAAVGAPKVAAPPSFMTAPSATVAPAEDQPSTRDEG